MRFFQEHEYISMDFARQDVLRVRVQSDEGKQPINMSAPEIGFERLPTGQREPLKSELESFLECARSRRPPAVDGAAGRKALAAADRVMEGILEHARRVKVVTTAPETRQTFTPQETR